MSPKSVSAQKTRMPETQVCSRAMADEKVTPAGRSATPSPLAKRHTPSSLTKVPYNRRPRSSATPSLFSPLQSSPSLLRQAPRRITPSRQPSAGPSGARNHEASATPTFAGSIDRNGFAGSSIEASRPNATLLRLLTIQPIDIDQDEEPSPPPSPTLSIRSNRSGTAFTAFDAPDTPSRARASSSTSTASRAMSMGTATPFERAPPILPSRQRPIHPKRAVSDETRDSRLAGLPPPKQSIPSPLLEAMQAVNRVAQVWLLAPAQVGKELSTSDLVEKVFGEERDVEAVVRAMRDELSEFTIRSVQNTPAHPQTIYRPR